MNKKTYIEFLGDGDDNELYQLGVIHLSGAPWQADFTFCGITLDEDEFTAGSYRYTDKKIVTCENCISLINHSKGVKTKVNN